MVSVLRDVPPATANTPRAWSGRASALSSAQAAGWSEHGQTQRFLAVLKHLELRPGDTLLDYGCGTGRFCEFLPREVDYYGHDWADGLLDRVVREHERASVLKTLPDVEFDHVVAVGPFNLADNWSREKTWQRIDQLWSLHTRRTLIVSLYRGDDERCFRYSLRDVSHFVSERLVGCDRFLIDGSYLDNDLLLVAKR